MGWFFLAVVVALVLYAIAIYNRLVAGRNRFKNAFAQIDVQLTRRHDLIPNLVETAKGYMKHERETLENVIKARNAAVRGLKEAARDPSDPGRRRAASGGARPHRSDPSWSGRRRRPPPAGARGCTLR